MDFFSTIISDSEINGSLCFCDVETTGFSKDDHLLEIAILKVDNKTITKTLHYYINPGDNVIIPRATSNIHGITNEKMDVMRNNYKLLINGKEDEIQYQSDTNIAYPLQVVWEEIVDLLNTGNFIAHNAKFDSRFVKQENEKAVKLGVPNKLNLLKIIDTIAMYKVINPSGRASLDMLCEKYNVDKTSRSRFHGALIDTHLLFDVFLKMTRSQETSLLDDCKENSPIINNKNILKPNKRVRIPLIIKANSDEIEKHNNFIENKLK